MRGNFLWGDQERLLRRGDTEGAWNEVRDRATWTIKEKLRQILTVIRAMVTVKKMAARELTGPGTCLQPNGHDAWVQIKVLSVLSLIHI